MYKQLQEEMVKKTELLGKKERMCEQVQKKLADILNEKSGFLDRIEELETELKMNQDKLGELNMENDKFNGEYHDKIRQRDVQIDKLTEELKHTKSTLRSQENTVSYFRKKVEELNKQLEDEREEKITMQSEIRRIEHHSSKASSPRNNEESQSNTNSNIGGSDLLA
jgi:chromosome segregation ATPase